MKIPSCLKQKDTIGIVAPAGIIQKDKINFAIKTLNSWKLKVKTGEHVFDTYHYFAGTDEHRTSDFQKMLDDETIKAILCARGGYGTIRIIDKLNFTKFIKNPKWIIGFSDITVLHAYLNNVIETESIHGIMPINFASTPNANLNLQSLKKAIFSENLQYDLKPCIQNKQGMAKGKLIGGNLSVLLSLRGTKLDFNPAGKILFIEETGEYYYHLDRMLMNLKIAGVFNKLNGLIVGGMSKMNDTENSFADSVFDVINNLVKEYNFPVLYNFPAGHIEKNLALIFGREIQMEVSKQKVEIKYLH